MRNEFSKLESSCKSLPEITGRVKLALMGGMFVCGLSGCSLPPINLATPEPIKVDVNIKLDVYQYKGDEPSAPDAAQVSYEESVERMRNRMAEVQKLKDNRLVGEDHRGLLHLREKPAGEWGDYVERTVSDENADRTILMRRQAQDTNRALHEVQEEQWKLRTEKAYEGEWIEIPGDKPNTYRWVQAKGPQTKKNEGGATTPPQTDDQAPKS